MTIYNSVNELIVNKLAPILPTFANLDFPHFTFNFFVLHRLNVGKQKTNNYLTFIYIIVQFNYKPHKY